MMCVKEGGQGTAFKAALKSFFIPRQGWKSECSTMQIPLLLDIGADAASSISSSHGSKISLFCRNLKLCDVGSILLREVL